MIDYDALLRDAEQKLREVNMAIFDAKKAVDERFVDALLAAKQEVLTAKRAKEDAAVASASHPWIGKRVVRKVAKYSRGTSWRSTFLGYENEYGIVKIWDRRAETGGKTWGLPKPGDPYVRLLKKDGTEGKKFSELRERSAAGKEWTLESEAIAEQAAE